MLSEQFVVLGALASLTGASIYVRATLAGRTQPNRVTWGLWGLAPLIAFAAQVAGGVGLPALMTLAIALGPLAVFAASWVNPGAFWALTRRDLLCGVLSLSALAGWAITRQGIVAIVLSVVADAAAGLPTVAKAWRHPGTERSATYALSAAANLIALAALPEWRLETVAFPALLLTVGATIFTLVRFPTWGPGRGPAARPAATPVSD